jgi:hypothetical protein
MHEKTFNDPPPAFPELEEVIKMAQANLFNDGFLAPVFMFMGEDEQFNICIIPQEINNDRAKLAAALKMLVDTTKPVYHFLMTEAWMGSISKENGDEEAQAKLEKVTENGVESMPRSERDEVVLINASDTRPETKGRWLGHFKIIRDKENVIHNFSTTRWLKMTDEGQIKGRLII